MAPIVTSERLSEFREQGVTVLRVCFPTGWMCFAGVWTPIWLTPTRTRASTLARMARRFFVDYCNWARITEYRIYFQLQRCHYWRGIDGQQEGSAVPRTCPGQGGGYRRADTVASRRAYYCVDGNKTVSLWIPLDDVPRETTPEFISGSHKWDKFYRPQRFDGSALNEHDGLEDIPDINGHRGDYDILGWAVGPGDAIAFDYRTIHGAPANASKATKGVPFRSVWSATTPVSCGVKAL